MDFPVRVFGCNAVLSRRPYEAFLYHRMVEIHRPGPIDLKIFS
jgi:hypothetical protein